jgi:hypothetical protein
LTGTLLPSARRRARWAVRVAVWSALALGAPASVAACGDGSPTLVAPVPADSAWDGAPLVLQVNQSAAMPQTPNGSMVLSYINTSPFNTLGELAMTSGGGAPETLFAQAQATQPGIVVRNWGANNLRVTNVSLNAQTPIRIQAIGPGMPGTTPVLLSIGTPLVLAPEQTAVGATQPSFMQLVIQNTSGERSVVAVIGGPQDSTGNNAYVIAVNADSTTGPVGSTNPPPPPGYFATTTGNTFTLGFNWGGASIFVANLSSSVAPPVTLVLRAL